MEEQTKIARPEWLNEQEKVKYLLGFSSAEYDKCFIDKSTEEGLDNDEHNKLLNTHNKKIQVINRGLQEEQKKVKGIDTETLLYLILIEVRHLNKILERNYNET